jgi:hypothetical protein
MRKKKTIALALNRETLRTLALDRVFGGAGQQTNETGCTRIGCPTDRCPPTGGGGGGDDRSRRITEHTGCSRLVCC